MDSKRLWDVDWIVEELKLRPHTYETLAEAECKNNTCFLMLRKKMNKLFLKGKISKTAIPGTRWGKMIFYISPKDYYILVNSTRIGVEVYYFTAFEKISNHHIHIEKAHMLNGCGWVQKNNRVFYEGKILAFY